MISSILTVIEHGTICSCCRACIAMLPHSFLSFVGVCRPFFVTEWLRALPHPNAHPTGFPAVKVVVLTRAVKTSDASTPGQIMRPMSLSSIGEREATGMLSCLCSSFIATRIWSIFSLHWDNFLTRKIVGKTYSWRRVSSSRRSAFDADAHRRSSIWLLFMAN